MQRRIHIIFIDRYSRNEFISKKYEIVINEFSGLTGHTNMSVYANGELLGTYGSNLGDPDFNIFNGLSGGVM